MIRIKDIKIRTGREQMPALLEKISDILCIDKIYPDGRYPDFSCAIVKRSVDARKRPDIFWVYTVKLLISEEDEKNILKFFRTHGKDKRVRKALERIVTDPVTVYELPERGSIPDKGKCLRDPGNEAVSSGTDDKYISGGQIARRHDRPVVVGAGPAGLFCALALARRGLCPLLVERGDSVDKRRETVERFWETGKLDPESNVQFGEGGAGTFSDGKLNTLTKDTNGRNTFVLKTFHEHGAPESITVDAKPHIGTDILADVVKSIRDEIISLGGEVRFGTKLTDLCFENDKLSGLTLTDTSTGEELTVETRICVLCIGHSARDTFEMLYEKGIVMKQKSFAVGFRVIHPQSLVNTWAYGIPDPAKEGLPPADYKVADETSKGRRVYSFCMCPGGYVVNASSEDGRLCVNGMSTSARDGRFANSAIIAAIGPEDFSQDVVGSDHPLAGMYYQRRLEEEAYFRGKGCIPLQTFTDFAGQGDGSHVLSDNTGKASDRPDTSEISVPDAVMGRVENANLRGIFSEDIDDAVIEAMHRFGRSRAGFDTKAVMLGVEARTSSPVRIQRDETFQSNIRGLYPCGEGAGYAGGIMSAAVDGLRCAEQIIKSYCP